MAYTIVVYSLCVCVMICNHVCLSIFFVSCCSWLSAQSLEEQRLYLDRTNASMLKTAAASVC